MTDQTQAPDQVQLPGDSPIKLEMNLAQAEQLVQVLQKQPFEQVAAFLPGILVQTNAQVVGLIANTQAQKGNTQ